MLRYSLLGIWWAAARPPAIGLDQGARVYAFVACLSWLQRYALGGHPGACGSRRLFRFWRCIHYFLQSSALCRTQRAALPEAQLNLIVNDIRNVAAGNFYGGAAGRDQSAPLPNS